MRELNDYKFPEFNEDFEGMIPKSDGGSSGGGAFFVTDNNNTLDKTWAEISAASENSVVVLIKKDYGFGYLTHVIHTESPTNYSCTFMFPVQNQGKLVIGFRSYSAPAENDYPVKDNK